MQLFFFVLVSIFSFSAAFAERGLEETTAGAICGKSYVQWPVSPDKQVRLEFPPTGDPEELFEKAVADLHEKLKKLSGVISVSSLSKEVIRKNVTLESKRDPKIKGEVIETKVLVCTTYVVKGSQRD